MKYFLVLVLLLLSACARVGGRAMQFDCYTDIECMEKYGGEY